MIDLFSQLSDSDKATIENYIGYYGAKKEDRIALKEWLQNWSHSNQVLYKLLGNNFIHKVNFTYQKDKVILMQEMKSNLLTLPFKSDYYSFCSQYASKINLSDLYDIITLKTFGANAIPCTIKYKKLNNNKMLQISQGMKPIKALSKIINYFKDEFTQINPDYEKHFEEFRLKHSMIFNDKSVKGIMGFSIHPMDYLTMSDNNNNWSSCMSWSEQGCYRVGTIEMMNSNNVLCCYIESEEPYNFTPKDTKLKSNTTWNNKKWRSLCYFNKDIIMGGKSYPYANDLFSKFMIAEVRKLAQENLNKTFAFGPELYQDMIHINTNEKMETNRTWMHINDSKHNIIWDTKGMYNDMLNDPDTHYWCYRNKVKHKKIYNVSGKAPCLCCGNQIPELSEWDEEYNDRYDNVGAVICTSCYGKMKCNQCSTYRPNETYKIIHYTDGTSERICKSCFEKIMRYCPHCNKPTNININKNYDTDSGGWWLSFAGHHYSNKIIDSKDVIIKNYGGYYSEEENKKVIFESAFLCEDCAALYGEKLFSSLKLVSYPNDIAKKFKCLPNRAWSSKYRYKNLIPVPFDYEGEIAKN